MPEEYNLLRRSDGRIEVHCSHGIGHTVFSANNNYVHGCDGCESKQSFKEFVKAINWKKLGIAKPPKV
jgi:hypothetical protein